MDPGWISVRSNMLRQILKDEQVWEGAMVAALACIDSGPERFRTYYVSWSVDHLFSSLDAVCRRMMSYERFPKL